MTTIPLPARCLTLLPPWPQAIRYAGKRLENRSSGVAASLRGYRGLIGLSHSKTDLDRAVVPEEFDAVLTETRQKLEVGVLGRRDQWRPVIGKLWLVAELREILPPAQALGLPWHVPGQWGLILGRVWEVRPVPCMGGQGVWRSQWCAACKKIVADSHGLTCKTCLSKLVSGPECPALDIVTEVES